MTWIFWIVFSIVLVFGFVVFRGAPYVPSHRRQVERTFDKLRPIQGSDVVVDVGSGDGIVLRQASRRGAKAVGYELNPVLAVIAKFLSRHDSNVRVVIRDFWVTSLPPDTTVVYGFMVARDINKMAKKIQNEADRLNRPLEFISYGAWITDREAVEKLGAHHLYRFEPLQRSQP